MSRGINQGSQGWDVELAWRGGVGKRTRFAMLQKKHTAPGSTSCGRRRIETQKQSKCSNGIRCTAYHLRQVLPTAHGHRAASYSVGDCSTALRLQRRRLWVHSENVSAPGKFPTATVAPSTVWGHGFVWDFLAWPSTMGFGHLFQCPREQAMVPTEVDIVITPPRHHFSQSFMNELCFCDC